MSIEVAADALARCLAYVLRILLGEGLPAHLEAQIAYQRSHGAAPAARVCIVPSPFFGPSYGTPASLPALPLASIEGTPLLYGTPEIRREGERLVVHADVVASAFFLVTRYEEMVRKEVRDEHGRFPCEASVASRAGFLERPIVEEYGALLRKWLREAGVGVAESNRRFSVLLTHDVHSPTKYPTRLSALTLAAKALIGRKSIRKLPEAFAVAVGLRRDPHDTFGELFRLDGQTPTVYFFMASATARLCPTRPIPDRVTRAFVEKVRAAGASVGLHPSHDAGEHPELIAHEKARLEEICGFPVRRSRFHFLGFREIEHGWALANAGIDWDSSLAYAARAGFRLAVCHPIPLFDPVQMRPFGIEEHSLIVMDRSLSHPKAMALDETAAFECCRRLIQQTRKHNGEFVALWHNKKLAPAPGNYHPTLYRRLVTELVAGP